MKIIVRDGAIEYCKKLKEEERISYCPLEEAKIWLDRKLFEEFQEYIEQQKSQKAVEEIGDMIDVLYAIAFHVFSISRQELDNARQAKSEIRGGFGRLVMMERDEQRL